MTDANPTLARQRPHTRALGFALLAMILFLLVGSGILALWDAFSPHTPLALRLLMIAMSAIFLFLPARFAFVSLRHKWTTGRWTLTPEERETRLRIVAAKGSSRWARFVFLPVFEGILFVLAAVNMYLQLRQEIHAFQLVLASMWLIVAATSLWRLFSKYRTAARS